MDEHGKAAVNLRPSLMLYVFLSTPAIWLLGLVNQTLIGTGLLRLVMPIVNAARAGIGEGPTYFLTIRFIS